MVAPHMRKTRIVCVSDTHNASPAHGAFKLPPGDVLIHAGDLTNQGSLGELQKTVQWLEDADFEAKIVIAGNHDITLDESFYAEHGLYFHNKQPQSPQTCRDLFSTSSSITYLDHTSAHIRLASAKGPHTEFTIFGSPYSPAHGLWAFGYSVDSSASLWSQIPLDTDIVVTHGPPRFHCDAGRGCEALRQALWRIRPRLHVCGHEHAGRGVERVRWDLESGNVRFKEENVDCWRDPGAGNNKQSLIDLTGNRPCWKLENDGGKSVLPLRSVGEDSSKPGVTEESAHYSPGKGLGGRRRGDVEALDGRMGRQETCIVNAAIMATSWPHSRGGVKQVNKPIVVDVDLPVWEEGRFDG